MSRTQNRIGKSPGCGTGRMIMIHWIRIRHIFRWQAKMYGKWAYLSTFSRFWAFIWNLGFGSESKWKVRLRSRIIVTSRIRIWIRIKVTRWCGSAHWFTPHYFLLEFYMTELRQSSNLLTICCYVTNTIVGFLRLRYYKNADNFTVFSSITIFSKRKKIIRREHLCLNFWRS